MDTTPLGMATDKMTGRELKAISPMAVISKVSGIFTTILVAASSFGKSTTTFNRVDACVACYAIFNNKIACARSKSRAAA